MSRWLGLKMVLWDVGTTATSCGIVTQTNHTTNHVRLAFKLLSGVSFFNYMSEVETPDVIQVHAYLQLLCAVLDYLLVVFFITVCVIYRLVICAPKARS